MSGSPWLRGYKQGSEYAQLKDKRHRKLKKWMADGLKHTELDGMIYFKCEWIDDYIERKSQENLHPKTKELISQR